MSGSLRRRTQLICMCPGSCVRCNGKHSFKQTKPETIGLYYFMFSLQVRLENST